VDGLVAGAIVNGRQAWCAAPRRLDVGRQRHLADRFERAQQRRPRTGDPHQDRPAFTALTDGDAAPAAHVDRGWDPTAEPTGERAPILAETTRLAVADLTHA